MSPIIKMDWKETHDFLCSKGINHSLLVFPPRPETPSIKNLNRYLHHVVADSGVHPNWEVWLGLRIRASIFRIDVIISYPVQIPEIDTLHLLGQRSNATLWIRATGGLCMCFELWSTHSTALWCHSSWLFRGDKDDYGHNTGSVSASNAPTLVVVFDIIRTWWRKEEDHFTPIGI